MKKNFTDLYKTLEVYGETCTFVIRGPGNGIFATGSPVNIKHVLAAKGYKEGEEFQWHGPLCISIQKSCLDFDILNVLQVSGARQVAGE